MSTGFTAEALVQLPIVERKALILEQAFIKEKAKVVQLFLFLLVLLVHVLAKVIFYTLYFLFVLRNYS
jgi:hypothetical protein